MDTPQPPQSGQARCALHVQALAVRTCERCGAFMCATCAAGELPGLCPVCRVRVVQFGLRRDAWTFSDLLDRCIQVFKVDWLMLSLAGLVFAGSSIVGNIVVQVATVLGSAVDNQAVTFVGLGVGVFLSVFLQGIAALGLYRIAFDVLAGRRADLSAFVSQAHKVGRFLGLILLIVGGAIVIYGVAAALGFGVYFATQSVPAAVAVGLALALPAGIFFGLPVYFAPAELALEDVGPVEALRRVWLVISGFRGWAFLTILVAGVAAVAGVCACFVGVFPAYAFMHLLIAGLYLTLRRGSSVQPY
jgi:hypothetical protein